MKVFVYLLIYLLAEIAVCDESFKRRNASESELTKKLVDATPQKDSRDSLVQGHGLKANEEKRNATKPLGESVTNESIQSTSLPAQPGVSRTMSLNSGALLRGLYVSAGLGVLVMAYIMFRSFRLNKTRAQMVRKYGVLAHRQDVEMRPLPLEEEDDDDTTVFDASTVSTRESERQGI